jgi:hypothetical protein
LRWRSLKWRLAQGFGNLLAVWLLCFAAFANEPLKRFGRGAGTSFQKNPLFPLG